MGKGVGIRARKGGGAADIWKLSEDRSTPTHSHPHSPVPFTHTLRHSPALNSKRVEHLRQEQETRAGGPSGAIHHDLRVPPPTDRPMTTDLQTPKAASKSLGFGPRRKYVSRSLTARVLSLPIGGSPDTTSPLSPARTAACCPRLLTPCGPRKPRKFGSHVPLTQQRADGDARMLAPQ